MARLRLLLTLLATVFGFAWSAPVVHADAHIYDASVAERVDVQESGTISARTALVSAVREGSVPSARDAQGAPTTPLALENATKADSPVWQSLKPFRGKTKTNGLSGSKKEFYEWDYTHCDIEVYDKNGKHKGSMDPRTGEMIKPAVPGYEIDI